MMVQRPQVLGIGELKAYRTRNALTQLNKNTRFLICYDRSNFMPLLSSV